MIRITTLLLVVTLSSCHIFKKPEACESIYQTSFYVAACNADLVLVATQREIKRREALGYDPEELSEWQRRLNRAWDNLDIAEETYRTDGSNLLQPHGLLDTLLRELDAWAKGVQENG